MSNEIQVASQITQAQQWAIAWLSAGHGPDRIRKEIAAKQLPPAVRIAINDVLLAHAADRAVQPQYSPEAIRQALARLSAGGLDLSDLRQWCRTNLNRADLDVAEGMLATEEARRASIPAPRPRAIAPWSVLAPEGDSFRHVLILGPTGGGKTVLTEWIAHQQPGTAKVLTPKRKATQWRGLEVVGHPRNYEALGEAWAGLIDEMNSRLHRIDGAGTAYQHLNVIADELPAQAANIPKHQRLLTTLLRESRESLIRLWVLVQGGQVRTIGLEGESDLKECLQWVRLGKFARAHGQKLYRDGLIDRAALDWLLQQKYPATIDDAIAEVPNLSEWSPVTSQVTSRPTSQHFPITSTPENLGSAGSLMGSGTSGDPATSTDDPVDPGKLEIVRHLIQAGVAKTKAIEQVFGTSGGRNFQRISSQI